MRESILLPRMRAGADGVRASGAGHVQEGEGSLEATPRRHRK
jgi:hypothetical protein